MRRSLPLIVLLALQAGLLFFRLDLLPVWNDELHTLKTVAEPVPQIVRLVRQDIHPPLYFVLLHYWTRLSVPWQGIVALRAFSALWALLATGLLDWFWTRSMKPFPRWLALSLFALSPCLLLYGRMARSYSMQLVLALLSVALLRLWMRQPRSLWAGFGSVLAVLGLLYTHYAPGLAIAGAFVLIGWRFIGAARLLAFSFVVAAGYAPWDLTLLRALRGWVAAAGFSSTYTLSGSRLLEPIVKIGFGLVSLTIGESFFGLCLLLVPIALLLAFHGARASKDSRQLFALVGPAAVFGYLAVSRWVSYPFIPARLLWLLPFLTMAVAVGISRLDRLQLRWSLAVLILVSHVSSAVLYFRRENFLNLGYTAPLPEIASVLNKDATSDDLILIDAYNTDWPVITWQLSRHTPYLVLDPQGAAEAQRRIPFARTVWIVRNTRDVGPGRVTTTVQSRACAARQERDTLLEPYADWQRIAMRWVGIDPPVTHFYQLIACDAAAQYSGRQPRL